MGWRGGTLLHCSTTQTGLAIVVSEAFGWCLVLVSERHLPFAIVSEFNAFCDAKRVFQLDTQISHRTVHFRVAKQKLDRA